MKTKLHLFTLISIPDGETATWYVQDQSTKRTTKGGTLRAAKAAFREAIKTGALPQEAAE